jgi:hypothetical protein
MRPIVNLASKPFRNRRLFWLAILAIFGLSSYFGLVLPSSRRSSSKANSSSKKRRWPGCPRRLLKPIQKRPSAPLTITQDKNRELLVARELIERRAFSWSQLLNDIERHIPANVRVVRIAVTRSKLKTRMRGGGTG